MEGKIEVFDNFLSKEDFAKIKELPLKLDWKFLDHKVDALDGHCQFVHLFYNKNDTDKKSSFYNLLSPLIDKMNIKVFGFLGKGGGECLGLCDISFLVPSNNTAAIQEAHMTAGHALMEAIEDSILAGE